ncbi:hypothetical protein KUCAC02_024832 [Chaenocephalus aceratus]|nr:hypothetical protein KUCAC02_024832 [Chaenocephalus aceratus]
MLASLRIEAELREALKDDLSSTEAELQTVMADLSVSITNIKSDAELEHLSAELERADNKCEDLEARSRRNNLEKEPLLDRAHRALQPKPRPGERPRTITARLHYHADCADIVRRARAQQRIKIGDFVVSIFPDHTSRTARARAAFNDVRRQLHVDDPRFMNELSECLPSLRNNPLIFGGDMNLDVDPSRDRSSPKTLTHHSCQKLFLTSCPRAAALTPVDPCRSYKAALTPVDPCRSYQAALTPVDPCRSYQAALTPVDPWRSYQAALTPVDPCRSYQAALTPVDPCRSYQAALTPVDPWRSYQAALTPVDPCRSYQAE